MHHFLPGMAIVLLTGGAAIAARDDRREGWLSVPFGVGAALTLDEVSLLAGRSNPYWGGEQLALAQGAAAGLACIALAGDFFLRGRAPVSAKAPGAAFVVGSAAIPLG